MKRNGTTSDVTNRHVRVKAHASKFTKVEDGRKQPIRGLWVRNGRYYARLNVENPITGAKKTKWVPLLDKENNPVATVPQAKAELERKRTQRGDDNLPTLGRTPKFADYVTKYLENIGAGQGAKSPATVQKEKSILAR